MAYVITQACCNDASCIPVCPVNCIHPTPDEAPFMRTEILHIDPESCIDCGACVEECPVEAIVAEDELTEEEEPYRELNADYFRVHPFDGAPPDFESPGPVEDLADLRVAIVGSGPSAFFAAMALDDLRGPVVQMYERLYTPFGLVRYGVAPDHQTTKAVTRQFASLHRSKTFTLNLGVEVGKHVSHEELLAHNHAVVYAVGASSDRRMEIAGEDLPGSHAATEFVGWYNGHPDHTHHTFDLSGTRAVIVGNGNVALDVARILLSDPEHLHTDSDIADHALEALRNSRIKEVVVVGRRGIAQAGYTNPEMIALCNLPDVDVIFDPSEVRTDDVVQHVLDDEETESSVDFKVRFAQEHAGTGTGRSKRLVMRFLASPMRIHGEGRVESVEIALNRLEVDDDGSVSATATGATDVIDTGLVFRSVGYRGVAVPGVPFDEGRGVIANEHGRVIDPETREQLRGVYTTGWIKRGPSGVIGTNKKCADDVVKSLVEDFLAETLDSPASSQADLDETIASRQPDRLDFEDWTRLDRAEREAGGSRGRPRIKFIDAGTMLDVVRSGRQALDI